jgi:hypothetical protein
MTIKCSWCDEPATSKQELLAGVKHHACNEHTHIFDDYAAFEVTKPSADDRTDAQNRLREIVAPGAQISCILRHVSRSGMSRRISLIFGNPDGTIVDLTRLAARALGEPVKQRGEYVQDAGMTVSGCGMDMGFDLVYRLGIVLFPKWECIGERCNHNSHCNDHNAPRGSGIMHSGGGYALRHRWI